MEERRRQETSLLLSVERLRVKRLKKVLARQVCGPLFTPNAGQRFHYFERSITTAAHAQSADLKPFPPTARNITTPDLTHSRRGYQRQNNNPVGNFLHQNDQNR